MTNRIAKYLDRPPIDDPMRVVTSVCALLAIEAVYHNFRQTTWNELPDRLKPQVQSLYNSFAGEKIILTLTAEFYKQFYEAMNSLGEAVTARNNQMKGSE